MDTNLISATVTSIQSDLLGTIWSAIKPHVFSLTVPMVGIMLLVWGIKILVGPFIHELGAKWSATIFRLSAIAFGMLWLWIWPMIQNYLATIGTGNPSWEVDPYPLPIIIFGGLAYGLFNIVLYDKLVKPFYSRFVDRRKK